MIKLITILFLILNVSCFSQSIEFIEVFQQKAKFGAELNHLNTLSDTLNVEYMGKVKVSYSTNKLDVQKLFKVYKQVVEKTTGANFYSEYKHQKTDSLVIVCYNLYYSNDQNFIIKNSLANSNKVYVFGSLDSPSPTYFKANNLRVDLPFGTYHATDLKKEVKLKINKGSITGETRTYKWKKETNSRFLTFSDFGFSLAPATPGLAINTGRFYEMDSKYGLFLVSLFKEVTH